MGTALIKSLPISGCAVYKVVDGVPTNPLVPHLDSVTITLPSIEFETTDISMMGTFTIPDFTRVTNMNVTINAPMDNPAARELAVLGLAEWKITWVSSHYDSQTGLTIPTGWEVHVKGYVTSIPNAEVSVGGENMGDISMNVLSIKKMKHAAGRGAGESVYDINRSTGKVIVNGVDYSSATSALF